MSHEGRKLSIISMVLNRLQYQQKMINQLGLLDWASTTEVCHAHHLLQREPLIRITYATTTCRIDQYENCTLTNSPNATECTIHLGLNPMNLNADDCQDQQKLILVIHLCSIQLLISENPIERLLSIHASKIDKNRFEFYSLADTRENV